MIARFVLWLVQTYLREKYRLVTPVELNKMVDDYLAELPKLGLQIVKVRNDVGDRADEIDYPNRTEETSVDSPRVSSRG